MKKLVSYPLSALFYFSFGFFLLLFQPLQWLAYRFFGYKAHKKVVDVLNLCLFSCNYLLGNSVTFINRQNLPANRPIIFIANHQSMYDIPAMIWYLRRYHAKFISKIELTKGILSISFNLKYGGGANIDRKDSKQAIGEIIRLGERMQKNTWSCVIFPEGTRSRNGQVKQFQMGGVGALIKKCPDALVIPVAINNSWKMVRFGMFPLGVFNPISWTVLPPVEPANKSPLELVTEAEMAIKKTLQTR